MAYQRRLDRILQDDYLAGLDARSVEEIRRMRDDCEEEESGVSYARRVVQGKLDIVRAEATRRQGEGQDARQVLDALPGILGGDARSTGEPGARISRYLVPPHVQYHRREIDQIADDEALSNLASRSTDELAALVERLAAKEREMSELRQTLFHRIDRLQDELTRRYKSGAAQIGDVLGERA